MEFDNDNPGLWSLEDPVVCHNGDSIVVSFNLHWVEEKDLETTARTHCFTTTTDGWKVTPKGRFQTWARSCMEGSQPDDVTVCRKRSSNHKWWDAHTCLTISV